MRKYTRLKAVSFALIALLLFAVPGSIALAAPQSFTISGSVTTSAGTPVEAVTVTSSSDAPSTLTASDGSYSITVPNNWSGSITVSKSGWLLTPSSKSYSRVHADFTSENYTAYQPTITGYVKKADNSAISGATVTASSIGSTTTNYAGYYAITIPYNWSGSVSVSKTGYGFTDRAYTNIITDQVNQDFIARPPKISGTIRDANGLGVSGISISANNGGGSAVTAENGLYEITVPYGWSGKVIPAKAGWGFDPAYRSYTNIGSDYINQDYAILQRTISGTVTDANVVGIQSVTVSANNGGGSAVTNSSGFYSLYVPYGWSGTVTPAKTGWGFNPVSKSYTNVTSNYTHQHYFIFQPEIAGYINTRTGTGLSGVNVTADNGGSTTVTDSSGYFSLTVPYGWSGTITPDVISRYNFSPSSYSYTNVKSNKLNQFFTAWQPKISGYIKNRYAIAVASVQLSTDIGLTATTNSSGYYEIYLPYNWSGSITASKTNYSFDPPNISFSDLTTDKSTQNYIAFQPKISGHVKLENGNAAVSVTVSGNNDAGSTTTNSSGYYELIVPYDWSGTITPSRSGYGFVPASCTFSNVKTDSSNNDYAMLFRTISGYINSQFGAALWGVNVAAGSASTSTDIYGYYSLNIPYGFSGTVTPSKIGCRFDPVSRQYSDVRSNLAFENYALIQPVISGHATEPNGRPVQNVSVSANNSGGCVETDANGCYRLSVPFGWSGSLTANKEFWFFEPLQLMLNNINEDTPNQNFNAVHGVIISGYITTKGGYPVNADFDISNRVGQIFVQEDTGFYRFAVPPGWSGTVRPAVYRRTFEPAIRSYENLVFDVMDQNFVISPLIVRPDGTGDFPTIGDAVWHAFLGDEIILHPGIYTDKLDRDIYLYGMELSIRSIDPNNPDIINSTVLRSPAFYFKAGNTTFKFTVKGLTIKGALNDGPGIYCSGGIVEIQNCVIKECSGPGIFIDGYFPGTNAFISNCVISGNGKKMYNSFYDYGGGGVSVCWSEGLPITSVVILNSLISDNISIKGGGVSCFTSDLTLINCTILRNRARTSGGGIYANLGNVTINNSIVRDNYSYQGAEMSIINTYWYLPPRFLELSYSNVKADSNRIYTEPDASVLKWGHGNIDVDPLFARLPNDGSDGWQDDPLTTTIDESANNDHGDFHLKSQIGRYNGLDNKKVDLFEDQLINLKDFAAFANCFDSNDCNTADFDNSGTIDYNDIRIFAQSYLVHYIGKGWVIDDVTSPCIDAGDPNSDWTKELWPHGQRINMGAYGNTPQASMSLSTAGSPADLNNDDYIDSLDLTFFADFWLCEDMLSPADLNRDGLTNFLDFAPFADTWPSP